MKREKFPQEFQVKGEGRIRGNEEIGRRRRDYKHGKGGKKISNHIKEGSLISYLIFSPHD